MLIIKQQKLPTELIVDILKTINTDEGYLRKKIFFKFYIFFYLKLKYFKIYKNSNFCTRKKKDLIFTKKGLPATADFMVFFSFFLIP